MSCIRKSINLPLSPEHYCLISRMLFHARGRRLVRAAGRVPGRWIFLVVRCKFTVHSSTRWDGWALLHCWRSRRSFCIYADLVCTQIGVFCCCLGFLPRRPLPPPTVFDRWMNLIFGHKNGSQILCVGASFRLLYDNTRCPYLLGIMATRVRVCRDSIIRQMQSIKLGRSKRISKMAPSIWSW